MFFSSREVKCAKSASILSSTRVLSIEYLSFLEQTDPCPALILAHVLQLNVVFISAHAQRCFYICACATVVVALEKLCSCWALDPLINNWATCLKVKNPAVRGAVGQMTSVLTSFANDYVSNSCVITSHMGVPQCLSVVLNASSHLACFVFA